jgi:molybdopterin synthase catalytic subunit
MVTLTTDKIDTAALIKSVASDSSGAIDVFIGTTRNATDQRRVLYLEFESHKPMAIRELEKIVDEACNRWPILKAAVVHRLGRVDIGEEAVVIAVSSPHRKAAFEACEYIIDTLKQTVPIWKREVFEDGQVWVAAHP